MTSLRPKRLNLREMWQLHRLLKMNKDKLKEYLADELMAILDTVSSEGYGTALLLLYGDKINLAKVSPIDSLILLSDGLNANKFFDFCAIIEGVNGSS